MANDVFLGLIALGVLVMAAIQVGAIVFALRAARRVEGVLTQLQQDVRPIVANLQAMSADAARTTAKVAGQVDRLETLLTDMSKKIDQTASAVQQTVLVPVREAMSVVQGIKAAIGSILGGVGGAPRRKSPATSEEEDALFIG
jgi:hypothetical protein